MRKTKIMYPLTGDRVATVKKATWKDILFTVFTCIIIIGVLKQIELPKTISPVPAEAQVKAKEKVVIATPIPTATPTPIIEVQPDREEIAAYIKEVFGKDADKAFLVLSCENNSLNPDAVNTAGNEPAGSRDIGVFQINEYWQGVNGKFLFNWKINVLAAHQIFTDNGNSFERWTCGRKYGI